MITCDFGRFSMEWPISKFSGLLKAHENLNYCQSSGFTAQHYCHSISISTRLLLVITWSPVTHFKYPDNNVGTLIPCHLLHVYTENWLPVYKGGVFVRHRPHEGKIQSNIRRIRTHVMRYILVRLSPLVFFLTSRCPCLLRSPHHEALLPQFEVRRSPVADLARHNSHTSSLQFEHHRCPAHILQSF